MEASWKRLRASERGRVARSAPGESAFGSPHELGLVSSRKEKLFSAIPLRLPLWNNRRRSILTGRQHLVGEAEYLLCELPLELREYLPDTKAIRPRLAALARRNRRRRYDAPTRLRLQLLDHYRAQIKALHRQERQVIAQLQALVSQSGSTLGELCGLSTRPVAELLVEVGDPRRFTEGGVARFSGSAPLPASTAEGPDEPIRHRYNPGGNRRINAILYRMALTSRAARHAPSASTLTPAPVGTPRKKLVESSNATSPTSSTAHDPRPADPAHRPTPPGRLTVRGRRAVKDCPTRPSAASRPGVRSAAVAAGAAAGKASVGVLRCAPSSTQRVVCEELVD